MSGDWEEGAQRATEASQRGAERGFGICRGVIETHFCLFVVARELEGMRITRRWRVFVLRFPRGRFRGRGRFLLFPPPGGGSAQIPFSASRVPRRCSLPVPPGCCAHLFERGSTHRA